MVFRLFRALDLIGCQIAFKGKYLKTAQLNVVLMIHGH